MANIQDLGKNERYHIYIGMNDKEKLRQLCSTEDFISIVSSICQNYRIAFSLQEQTGGYMMADGTFIVESSLVLSIMGLSRDQILSLAAQLRNRLNQESILITCDNPEILMVKE